MSIVPDGCVISYFYIKPQLLPTTPAARPSCVISYFYIKPQQIRNKLDNRRSCVISYFYIKPQQRLGIFGKKLVVLYLTSTSNHNH